jgi:hypothetical protein
MKNKGENSCMIVAQDAIVPNIPTEGAENRANYLRWCNEDRVECEKNPQINTR